LARRFAIFLSLIVSLSTPASMQAGYVYVTGVSETVYGVADYGLPAQLGNPVYISNNLTLLNDVLISPGGGFLTADTSIPNNIADTGIVGLPYYSAWVGGGNANGVFGAGQTLLTPNLVAFTLLDVNPDGTGRAAYLVASIIATFTEDGTGFGGAPEISVGTWLAIAGIYGSPLSSAAVSLTAFVKSANAGSPFHGGRSYELVLAAAAIGNYNTVAYSDINDVVQPTKFMFNDGVSPFFGLAVASEKLPTAGMIGDTITVKATLTAIADPMFLDSIDPTAFLISQAGPLPDFTLLGTTAVPEPSSVCLVAAGSVLCLLGAACRRNRFARQMAAS
jgi:hypothetical protein